MLAESKRSPVLHPTSTFTDLEYSLAYLEMRIVLARLLWNFNLEKLAPSCEDWANQEIYLFWNKSELLVQLKPIIKDMPKWAEA